ncbi:hypothetical protein K439DRAFT_1076680 [Ramaria rubella]|nr:hypothetical protein K439DRAFT_1076680 [Ramaria rubella]
MCCFLSNIPCSSTLFLPSISLTRSAAADLAPTVKPQAQPQPTTSTSTPSDSGPNSYRIHTRNKSTPCLSCACRTLECGRVVVMRPFS